ncbi:MAG: hypothetical protein ACR2OD_03445 [Gaiellaceae bacterium]
MTVLRRLLLSQIVLWAVVLGAVRVAGVPPEGCPPVTVAAVDAALGDAVTWVSSGLEGDGRYRYGYDRGLGSNATDYNITRHAGVVLALFQLAVAGDDRGLDAAERGLAFIDANLRPHSDWIAFATEGGQRSLGATSLALAAIMHRREATGDQAYDDTARGMGRFILALQESRGSILSQWSPRTEAALPETYGRFATGEAFWALTLLDRAFPGEGWAEATVPVARYLATERDQVEDLVFFTDHWAAYGFAELDAATLEAPERRYARRQAGLLGTSARLDAQSDGGPLGQLVRGPRTSGAGLGTIGEGLGGYWRLSRTDERFADLEADLGERLTCLAARAVERQATPAEAERDGNPEAVLGAWFTDNYTQMDDQQHIMAALIAARAVLVAEEQT